METLEMTTSETTNDVARFFLFCIFFFFLLHFLLVAPHKNQNTRDCKHLSYNQSEICSAWRVGVERRCLFANHMTPSAVISVQSTLQWNNCTYFEETPPQRDRKRFAAAVRLQSLPTVRNSACHPSSSALHFKSHTRSMCCSGGKHFMKKTGETNRRCMWHSKQNISLSFFWFSNSLNLSHESELKERRVIIPNMSLIFYWQNDFMS